MMTECLFLVELSLYLFSLLFFRHTDGEHCLSEEVTAVLSSAKAVGRVLLLAGRLSRRPGAQWPFPERVHQEEFHSVKLGGS